MRLHVYMAIERLSNKKFSEFLDISPRYLSHLKSGQCKCGKRLARDIEKYTKGMVKYTDLIDEYLEKQSRKSENKEKIFSHDSFCDLYEYE